MFSHEFCKNFKNTFFKQDFWAIDSDDDIVRSPKKFMCLKQPDKFYVFESLQFIKIYCINRRFQWQFLITNPGFWLVNILFRNFDTSSKKWNENDKNWNLLVKNKKMSKINENRVPCFIHYTKWIFPLRISSINVSKSAGANQLTVWWELYDGTV